jgi:hypothetical protein
MLYRNLYIYIYVYVHIYTHTHIYIYTRIYIVCTNFAYLPPFNKKCHTDNNNVNFYNILFTVINYIINTVQHIHIRAHVYA